MSQNPQNTEDADETKDANICIGAGVGVGVLGAGAALISGAVCPLCYIVPPLLVGVGVIKKARISAKKDITRRQSGKAEQ